MILRDNYWLDVLPSRKPAGARVEGKWLHFGPTPELHSWLDRLERLVETGRLSYVKVARKLPGYDPFPDKPCVLCVYTASDEKSKRRARETLADAFGIEVTVWKSDAETERDWQPDGSLRLELERKRSPS